MQRLLFHFVDREELQQWPSRYCNNTSCLEKFPEVSQNVICLEVRLGEIPISFLKCKKSLKNICTRNVHGKVEYFSISTIGAY